MSRVNKTAQHCLLSIRIRKPRIKHPQLHQRLTTTSASLPSPQYMPSPSSSVSRSTTRHEPNNCYQAIELFQLFFDLCALTTSSCLLSTSLRSNCVTSFYHQPSSPISSLLESDHHSGSLIPMLLGSEVTSLAGDGECMKQR